jgi:hypothetical protein
VCAAGTSTSYLQASQRTSVVRICCCSRGAASIVLVLNFNLCACRITLDASLRHAAPLIVQSVAAILQGVPDDNLAPTLTYLATWLPTKFLPDTQLAALIPLLIALLNSQNPSNTNTNDTHTEWTQHIGAALSDLLAHPPISWGPAVLLEPLLIWAHTAFPVFASPDVAVSGLARTADDAPATACGARRRGRGVGCGAPRRCVARAAPEPEPRQRGTSRRAGADPHAPHARTERA